MVKRIGTKGKRLRLILLNLLILTIDDFLKTTMKRVNLRLSELQSVLSFIIRISYPYRGTERPTGSYRRQFRVNEC